jgi:raffinose/stachyose/melibiose transport system substrate-binding protein
MKSSTSRTAVAAVACLLAAACTGGTTDSAGSDDGGGGGQTLRYLIEQQEDATAQEALQEHIDADFTEESGIEVEVETLPLEVMRTVLQTQLRSGEGPDVFAWGSGPGFGGALAEAGSSWT